MFCTAALTAFTFAAVVLGQQVGTLTTENHPALSIQQCTAPDCTTQQKSVVLGSHWRWTHSTAGATNCYTGNAWDPALCPSPATCATNCAVDGADYSGTYGVTTSGSALTLRFVTNGPYSQNIGSRVYLLDDADHYKMFDLKNQEFTFDVDMSGLPCGLNGALYFSEMAADGGKAAHAGTGYCDAQCPHDIKWINGEANVLDWSASATDVNAGNGRYGACCTEMDIWEANSEATSYTPHVYRDEGLYRCSGTECGDGNNRYGGNFLGRGSGKTIDTTKKVTVVTQFITDNNTPTGNLAEIRRVYVQDGVVYQNSFSAFPSLSQYNSISDEFCYYNTHGATTKMGDAFDNGMVLIMSLWSDHAAHMLWLDSDYPLDKSPSEPGVSRGACPTSSGDPDDVVANHPNALDRQPYNASVTFSNIKYGPIGSTFGGSTPPVSSGGSTVPPVTSTTSSGTTTPTAGTVPKWGQCGGIGYGGPTACVAGSTCTYSNDWYSQCL
ncbi:cellulose 1,4-beta-cellobiosidase precursor [Pleurotus eryngii]|uniref:Glucanase n=1 Tax=Pleurotus eryngii TaxID=5323 RepID=A0A9P5ZU61_PLEER|nr:cellulose 1,4-beta-cellobiosidase precursor [Pleurotus eryngii]